MAAEPGSVRLHCIHCQAGEVIDDSLLGTSVTCASCQETYDADWGEPVAPLVEPEETPKSET